jgi:NAD(P)H-hydrate repair Nnr-like enzyme with NAD(P)H-hydrate dehydratase domain
LLAKKTQERQKQLEQYERLKGTSATSAGAAAGAGFGQPQVAAPSAAQSLVSELTIQAPPEPVPENAVKAQQMRNALTQQLKQTLIATGTGSQLDSQLGRLDAIQQGR